MSEKWIVNSDHTKEEFLKHVERLYENHKHVTFSFKTGRQRTSTQNASMHLYFTLLSNTLNDAGLDFRQTLRQDIDVPWNEGLIKDYMWRPVQKAITGHTSTTKPKTTEYTEIYEALNRHTAQRFGISLPWPCKDD